MQELTQEQAHRCAKCCGNLSGINLGGIGNTGWNGREFLLPTDPDIWLPRLLRELTGAIESGFQLCYMPWEKEQWEIDNEVKKLGSDSSLCMALCAAIEAARKEKDNG